MIPLLSATFGIGLWLLFSAFARLIVSASGELQLLQSFITANELPFMVLAALTSSIVVSLVVGDLRLSVLGTLGGALVGRKFARKRQTAFQNSLLLQQRLLLPQFIELVSIGLAAGLSLRSALQKASQRVHPLVGTAWQFVVDEKNEKKSLAQHFDDICRRYPEQPISRVANAFLIASERGTPMQQALAGLSSEFRSEARRELLELAAKKEVQMMLPVVFGILPSVTLIALYPAFASLAILN